jgi:PII-like signaling protein/CBS-domain-containing membrane protein
MDVEVHMTDLSSGTPAKRLRIYISEADRWRGKPLSTAILEFMRSNGMSGATVFRGIAGFGAHSHLHTTQLEVLSMELPVVVEIVDTPEKISTLIESISHMVFEGLITVDDVNVVKYTHRYLNPLPVDRLVSEVMTRDVVTLSPAMPIHQAWQCMLEKSIKALPVMDGDGYVVGILTDEDLLARAGIQQRLSVAIRMGQAEIERQINTLASSTLIVADVMSHPVIIARVDEPLGLVTTRMIKSGLKRLPVVDSRDKLVGMVSRLDILRQVANLPQNTHTQPLKHPAGRTVGEVMLIEIPLLKSDDGLQVIIEKFAASDTHRLIVVDDNNLPVGLLSDSDVVSRVQPERRQSILTALRRIGRPPEGQETAADLMSPGVLTVAADCPIIVAVRKMLSESRKWMVVINSAGAAIGLIDRQILLEAIITLPANS